MLLSPKSLHNILNGCCKDGIVSAIVFTREGNILSCSGDEVGSDASTVTAAIASNIWSKIVSARDQINGQQLESVIIKGDKGWAAITSTHTFILCLLGSAETDIGMLQARLLSTGQTLEEPLKQVTSPHQSSNSPVSS